MRTYTAFAYVCVQLLRTLCGFCIHIRLIFCASCATFVYVYGFLCALIGFCVRIQLFVRYERSLRMDPDFWFLESLSDPILRFFWSVESTDDPILMVCWFVESPDDPILRVIWFVESPCKRSWWLDHLEYPSGVSDLQGSVKFFIWRFSHDSLSDLNWPSSYQTIFLRFTVRSYFGLFLVDLVEQ